MSHLILDLVPKPKPFKRVDTSSIAKTKMILNLGKTLAKPRVCLREILGDVYIRYKRVTFTYEYMHNTFRWFRNNLRARVFFMAYKYREYDSKMISKVNGFQYNLQLGPVRAKEILESTSLEELVSLKSLYKMYASHQSALI